MKTSHFIYALLAIILFASCGNTSSETQLEEFENENFQNFEPSNANEFAQNEGGYQTNNRQNESQNYPPVRPNETVQNNGGNRKGKRNFQIKNPQVPMPLGSMPIPSSWKATTNDKEVYLEGPNNLKIYNEVSNFYQFSNDPAYNQFMSQNGFQVKSPLTMEQAFQQILMPLAQQEGGKLVKKYPAPQIAANDRQFDRMFFKAMPEQTQFDAMVTEWENNDGSRTLILVKHKISDYGQGKQGWGFTYCGMESDAAAFEQAKQDFMFAALNIQINPQYVQYMNQQNQQATQQQMASHQQRMNDIRQFGENNTRRFNARSAAFDAQNNRWRQGQAASDRMQRKTINSINEVSTYRDQSGNSYEVDGYHNQVYTNGNGEVITTDDYNYNPNTDVNVNGSWEQLDATDDGWN